MTASAVRSAAASQEARDAAEQALTRLYGAAVRGFVLNLRAEVQRRIDGADAAADPARVLLAAAEDRQPPLTLGQFEGWWSGSATGALSSVLVDYFDTYRRYVGDLGGDDQIPASAVRDAVENYLPRAADRLSRKTSPSIAADAFDRVRVLLAASAGGGWSRGELSERMALELGWAPNTRGWQAQLRKVNAQIDTILDPLGTPGDPAREAARLGDPRVAALQADRRHIITRVDAEQSHWEVRANRIARTESTAMNGYASNRALRDEGFTLKRWVATHDKRTRDSHAEADGQEVPVDQAFIVNGYAMQFPGDPTAPGSECIGCRCTLIGAGPYRRRQGEDEEDAVGVAVEGQSVADQQQWLGLVSRSVADKATDGDWELYRNIAIGAGTGLALIGLGLAIPGLRGRLLRSGGEVLAEVIELGAHRVPVPVAASGAPDRT